MNNIYRICACVHTLTSTISYAAAAQVPLQTFPAQGPSTELSSTAPLSPLLPAFDSSQVRVRCSGTNSICAGDRLTLTATNGNGVYSWSPNVGLSATTGASVVAGPLVTTTYTVTSAHPTTGVPTTATIVVSARENCCPISQNRRLIVEIPGAFFDAATGSPFTNPVSGTAYPDGTRFHFTGGQEIIFSALAFQPPMGSTLLMDGGQDLVLQDGASLNLAGVSITAACDDMWGRLWVRNTAAGIRSTFTDGNDGWGTNPNNPGNIVPQSSPTTLNNQLSHSAGGIQFEQSLTTSAPYYELTNVDFLNNEQSIKLVRANFRNGSSNHDHVSFSTFSSEPAAFKTVNGTAAPAPHYSTYHVWFDGYGGNGWLMNTFRNAVFGVYNPASANAVGLEMLGNRFENLWLAAVNINSEVASSPIIIEGRATTLGVPLTAAPGACVFPTALALPATPQMTTALANDVLDHLPETRGIFSNALLICSEMAFTQAKDGYADFTFSQRTKQVGIKAKRLQSVSNCTFTLLHTGTELANALVTIPGKARGTALTENVFFSCRRGVEVHGAGIAHRGGLAPAPPEPVNLYLNCNTFDRGGSARPGTAYGIYLDANAAATFDAPAPTAAVPLSNKFLDYSTGVAKRYYGIYNASSVPATLVRYTTFGAYVMGNAPQLLPGHSNLAEQQYNVKLVGKGSYVAGQACGWGHPGLQRAALPTNMLEPCSPTPSSGFTTLHYQLAEGTTTADVHIRRVADGLLVHQAALQPGSTACPVSLLGWAPGLYTILLSVDGLPVKTMKLFVQ